MGKDLVVIPSKFPHNDPSTSSRISPMTAAVKVRYQGGPPPRARSANKGIARPHYLYGKNVDMGNPDYGAGECGADSKFFPCGFFAGALSQAHLNLEIEWMRHVPIGAAALGVHTSLLPSLPVMLPSPPALRHDGHLDSATTLLRQSAPWLQRACVLCGYGDNSVQHWMSSCACLGVAGSLLLGCSWCFSHWFPQAHWPRTQSARCYALYAETGTHRQPSNGA